MSHWLWRLLRHRRLDESDAARLLGRDALERLQARVAESEKRHSGEIRICIEAGLPLADLRRRASARDRAVAVFADLRVWDTEHRNGVLIYLLLAERAIEVVADRGLDRLVDAAEWQRLLAAMAGAFREAHFEEGLAAAVDAVDALLARHFPLAAGRANINELPDAPVMR